MVVRLTLIIAPCRASFYSQLPVGHNKSAEFLVQISCEVAINVIPNFAYVIFTLRKCVVFQIVYCLRTQRYVWICNTFPPSDTIFGEATGHLGCISCDISQFPAGISRKPAGKVTPCLQDCIFLIKAVSIGNEYF